MPSSDEDFVDFVLNTISEDIKRLGHFSNGLLDGIDKQFNSVAHSVRETLHSSPWVPDKVRPTPPPAPRAVAISSPIERLQRWVDQNRAITAAIVAFLGTGAFYIWRAQRRSRRVRCRARRAPSGAKTEVVILAGSPYSHLTLSLASDFERRGFLVFIPVTSLPEEAIIADLRLSDVRPLNFDITSADSTQKMLDTFSSYLTNPQRHGTAHLNLTSLVIADVDVSAYPTASIRNIPPSLWLDSINSHVVYPISLIHAFLPLLTAEKDSAGNTRMAKKAESTIVVLTQSNTSSIEPADHACESLSTAALASYTRTLQTELPPWCRAVHLRLGAFEMDEMVNRRDHKALTQPHRRSSKSARHSALSLRGRPMDELHLAVFDAVTGRSSGTVFVGGGARSYALIGALAPRSLVQWMMGERLDTVMKQASRSRSARILEGGWQQASQSGASGASGASGSESEGVGRSIEWETVSAN